MKFVGLRQGRNLEIVQVTHSFLPESIGGRETHVLKLSKHLSLKGHSVTILAGGPRSQVGDLDGVSVERYRDIRLRLCKSPTTVIYRIVPGIFMRLLTIKADIVHAHDYGHFTTDMAALACLIRGIPLVVTIHGFKPPSVLTRLVLRMYDLSLGRQCLKLADRIIVVSDSQMNDLLAKGLSDHKILDKIIEIPNGVDPPSKVGRGFLRRSLGLTKDDIVVLAAGRVIERKGFARLIEIAPELLRANPRIKFLIVGPDGGQLPELRRMTERLKLGQTVIMTGELADNKYLQAFSDADLVVVPSDYEGVPTVLLQAMAYGKPIVATEVGGNSRVIKDLRDGILVENNSLAVMSGILRLLNDRRLSRHIGQCARFSVRRFLWTKIAEQIEHLYYDTLESC